jgi:hypothetical protein
MGDPMRERIRLARSGTGDHKQRSVFAVVFDGMALLVVQGSEIVDLGAQANGSDAHATESVALSRSRFAGLGN